VVINEKVSYPCIAVIVCNICCCKLAVVLKELAELFWRHIGRIIFPFARERGAPHGRPWRLLIELGRGLLILLRLRRGKPLRRGAAGDGKCSECEREG
jgi:hypothetical protein